MRRWLIRLVLATVFAGAAALLLMAADHAGRFDLVTALRAVAFDQSFVKFFMSGLGERASQSFDAFIIQHPGVVAWIGLWVPALGVVALFLREARVEGLVKAQEVQAGTITESLGTVSVAHDVPPPPPPAPPEDADILEAAISTLESDRVLTDDDLKKVVSDALSRRPDGYAFEYLLPVFQDIGADHESRRAWAQMFKVLYRRDYAAFDVTAESTVKALRSPNVSVAACAALRVMDAAFFNGRDLSAAWNADPDGAEKVQDALSDAIRSGKKGLTTPASFALFWLTAARNFGNTPIAKLRADDVDALVNMVMDQPARNLAINRGAFVLGKVMGGKVHSDVWLDWAAAADGAPAKVKRAVEPPEDASLRERIRMRLHAAQISDDPDFKEAKFGLAVLLLRLGEYAPSTRDTLIHELQKPRQDRELTEEVLMRLGAIGGEDASAALAAIFETGNAFTRLRAFLALVALKEASRLKTDDQMLTREDDTVDFDAAIERLKERARD